MNRELGEHPSGSAQMPMKWRALSGCGRNVVMRKELVEEVLRQGLRPAITLTAGSIEPIIHYGRDEFASSTE